MTRTRRRRSQNSEEFSSSFNDPATVPDKYNINIMDIITQLSEPKVAAALSTILTSFLQPLITQLVDKAVSDKATSSIVNQPELSMPPPDLVKQVLDSQDDHSRFVHCVNANFEKMQAEMESLRSQITELHIINNNLHKHLQEVSSEIAQLGEGYSELGGRLENQLQYSYAYNCLVHGVAEKNNEDPFDIVCNKLDELGLSDFSPEIETAHRLGKFRDNAKFPRPIVFKLFRRPIKREIISTYADKVKSGTRFNFAFSSHLTPWQYRQRKNNSSQHAANMES
jgi:hypothetical protein